jgi:NADH dehydrogenase
MRIDATRCPRQGSQVTSDGQRPTVVIVGGGFAGLEAARTLSGAPVQVVVVDRKNHHLFQPLLYQVASAALNPADIAAPIRHVLARQENARVVLGDVVAAEPDGRRLRLADGTTLAYDFLLLAAGATHSYFGHEAWAPLAPGLKTVEDALEIRRRVLTAFERAEREADPTVRAALLTFVVVGAGPTGVELAGALAEISRFTLARDFRAISSREARVVLLEGADRVLTSFDARLSAAARRDLERLGVEVHTGARVTRIDPEGVTVGERRFAARTVLWAAGVQAAPLARTLGAPLDPAGRVVVASDLTVPGHPEIAVVGDLAAALRPDGRPVPGVAPAAMQQGRHAARNVLRALRGEPHLAFTYRDKGSLATIGRARAVAELFGLRVTGVTAWLAWLFVHVWFIIEFRSRVAVILQWAWTYLTFGRGSRLIVETPEEARLRALAGAAPPDLPRASGAPPGGAQTA